MRASERKANIIVVCLAVLLTLGFTMFVCTKEVNAVSKITKPVVTVKNVNSEYIQLSWKKCAGAKTYKVYRATTKTGKYTLIGSTSKLSYSDKKVKENKTYYYKIKASNGNKKMDSSFSTVKSKKFKFEGKIVCPDEVIIYEGYPYYFKVFKGNTDESICIEHDDIKQFYHMEMYSLYKENENQYSSLRLEYDNAVSNDIVITAKLYYYKHPEVNKTIKIIIRDDSKVPGYEKAPKVPDFGALFGFEPELEWYNGNTMSYYLKKSEMNNYIKYIKSIGYTLYKTEKNGRGEYTYWITPDGKDLIILYNYILEPIEDYWPSIFSILIPEQML